MVADIDLVFDAGHGLMQTLKLSDPGQNIVVNLDVDGSGSMGAGDSGNGSMHLSDGLVVRSTTGYVGYQSGSAGTVTVRGEGSTWTNSHDLYVGHYGKGTLEITNGASVSNDLGYIGRWEGSEGAVTVSGPGSTWTNSDDLFICGYRWADGGDGTLEINNGGAVSNAEAFIGYSAGCTGAATVSGTGSTWTNSDRLHVGLNGNGTLDVLDGGSVGNAAAYIGSSYDSTGAVTVSGPEATWTNNGRLYVGYSGSGSLNIVNGGTVTSTGARIGYSRNASEGSATVSGAGSTWTNSGTLTLGEGGRGRLTITDRGVVTSTGGYLCQGSGSSCAVMVSGSGSSWANEGALIIDSDGDGSMEITDGAVVSSAAADVQGSRWRDSSHRVTVSGAGSIWTNSGYFFFGKNGKATMDITGGGTVVSGSGTSGPYRSYIAENSQSTCTVTVDGAGSAWTNSGNLYVGFYGAGVLNICRGGLVSSGAALTIDHDSDGDSYITMATGGMLALGGDAGGSLGEFLGIIAGSDDIRYFDEAAWDWLNITSAVSGRDYTLIHHTEGDLAGYTVLTVMTVPEPATLSLLALGGLAVLRRRR